MGWLSFTAAVVAALAWPITVLLIFLVLRQPLLRLIPLLERLRYQDFEIDFGRRLEEAATPRPTCPKKPLPKHAWPGHGLILCAW